MIANEVGSPNVNQKICFSKCSELAMEEWERDNPVLKAKCIKKKESITDLCFFTVRSPFIISEHSVPFSIQSLLKSSNSAHMIESHYQFFLHETEPQKIRSAGCYEAAHLHSMVHFRELLKQESLF